MSGMLRQSAVIAIFGITQRHHVSCAQAKRVLRQLKGNRRAHTVPMVCGRSRLVQGWRLKNLGRAFNVVWNSYQRGTVSFHYERVQHYGREYCRPPYGSGEEVG